MKLTGLYIAKQEQIWKLEADYAGLDAGIDATRVYTWKFMNTTELLAKVDELLKGEQN